MGVARRDQEQSTRGQSDYLTETFLSNRRDKGMGDKGSKDKGKREKQKKAQLSPKEKRKLRNEKKDK